MASWEMTVVEAAPSSVVIPLNAIGDEVKDTVEEAYAGLKGSERAIVTFDDATQRNEARIMIRSYCNARPAGRLKASLWSGYLGEDGKFRSLLPERNGDTHRPALSMRFDSYKENNPDGLTNPV